MTLAVVRTKNLRLKAPIRASVPTQKPKGCTLELRTGEERKGLIGIDSRLGGASCARLGTWRSGGQTALQRRFDELVSGREGRSDTQQCHAVQDPVEHHCQQVPAGNTPPQDAAVALTLCSGYVGSSQVKSCRARRICGTRKWTSGTHPIIQQPRGWTWAEHGHHQAPLACLSQGRQSTSTPSLMQPGGPIAVIRHRANPDFRC